MADTIQKTNVPHETTGSNGTNKTTGTNGTNGTNGHTYELEPSDLAKIENPPDNPYELFKEWFNTAKNFLPVLPHALVLSTATPDGKVVSSRTLLLRRLDEDGFVIMTDNRSRKHAQIVENKNAAINFLWLYKTGHGDQAVNRQVRIEGELEILERSQYLELYEREPLYCKIRAHLCHQDRTTDWEDAKAQHDEMYDKCKRSGVDLPMPDHFIAYKLHPRMIEFYHAYSDMIGDRIHYGKSSTSAAKWKRERLFA